MYVSVELETLDCFVTGEAATSFTESDTLVAQAKLNEGKRQSSVHYGRECLKHATAISSCCSSLRRPSVDYVLLVYVHLTSHVYTAHNTMKRASAAIFFSKNK